jgi:hypothetical protein
MIKISNIWTDLKTTLIGAAAGVGALLVQQLTTGNINYKGIGVAALLALIGGVLNVFNKDVVAPLQSEASGTV